MSSDIRNGMVCPVAMSIRRLSLNWPRSWLPVLPRSESESRGVLVNIVPFGLWTTTFEVDIPESRKDELAFMSATFVMQLDGVNGGGSCEFLFVSLGGSPDTFALTDSTEMFALDVFEEPFGLGGCTETFDLRDRRRCLRVGSLSGASAGTSGAGVELAPEVVCIGLYCVAWLVFIGFTSDVLFDTVERSS